jgi:hypothetical protein
MKRGLCAFVAIMSAGALFVAKARAEEKEPAAVVELGGAGEWDLNGGSGFGPSAAVEFTPIKNLLLEVGVAPLFSGGHADWGSELLFKKSFDLSNTVEFEPGIGPEWSSGGKIAGEVSFEFMIWPSPERKFGYFIEPTYSYSFNNGHEQSLGLGAGLLIAIP